jgi:hypothetical protein
MLRECADTGQFAGTCLMFGPVSQPRRGFQSLAEAYGPALPRDHYPLCAAREGKEYHTASAASLCQAPLARGEENAKDQGASGHNASVSTESRAYGILRSDNRSQISTGFLGFNVYGMNLTRRALLRSATDTLSYVR